MATNISSSVGEGGKNLPNDLAQIDNLLRKAGMLAGGPATPQGRLAAIKKFQEICGIRTAGKPDGKIDPGGMTLRRLNETASPLKLNPIKLGKIANGGYVISFTPEAPPKPYQLLLGPSFTPGDFLDVTGASHTDIMTAKNLPDLLKLIEKRNAWGQALAIKLFVALNGTVVSESVAQNLSCPVKPHNGKMLPLDQTNNGPTLTYQGDSATGPFYGRMFHKIEGFEGYFFKYAGNFETSNDHRGFDCITYAGTTCGAPVTSMAAAADLGAALGASKCTLEKPAPPPAPPKGPPTAAMGAPAVASTAAAATPGAAKIELESTAPQNIKDYLAKDSTGYYLLWSGGHVVIVADGSVHEFAYSKKGYATTPVETWLEPYKNTKLTLRKLPGKPPLAA
jgi:hypothetical protein